MAVTEIIAVPWDLSVAGTRPYPIDDHGKMRIAWGKATQGAVAGDAGSSVKICKLPQGRKRLLIPMCRYKVSALGAARVMDIGYDAYYARSEVGSAQEAADADAFADNIDVSAATHATFPISATTDLKYDIFSTDEVWLRATVAGGTIPALATFEFLIVYAYE